MTFAFRQHLDVLEHNNTTGSKINSGDVVEMKNLVGVALVDIPDTENGSVQVAGVFDLPKASGTSWTQGDTLDWDTSAGAFTKLSSPASGDITGAAVAAADQASADTTGEVLLNAEPGTIN